jgi:hypothetical protein
MNILKNIVCASALLGITSTSFSKEEEIGDDGYNKTYNDESKSFKDRMKEARQKPEITVANTYGGFSLGLSGDFGPIYDAEPQSSSGMGFGVGFEPGYVIQSESWSRIEFGAEIAYRSFSWKNSKDSSASLTPMSVIPRIGLGHSLGDNMFGLLRFGFGFATGQATMKSAGITSKTDDKMGFVLTGAYDVNYGTGTGQFFGGLGVNHYQWSFSELKKAGVTDSNYDGKLNLNYVNLHMGMRLKF